jgi:tripartite-type tricarboxylate transporter receptor subunit TctC
MKKILVSLIFWAGLAQASTLNHVWIPFPGGTLESQCRYIWNEYDLKHNTKTVFFIKPGVDGIIATQDMLNFTSSTRKFMCGGSNQLTSNALIHPNDNSIDRIEPLLQIAVNTMVWYVPNHNKSQTLPELVAYFKSINRPINVGVFFASQKAMVQYLEKTYDLKINLINYRSGPQMYPDLASGSLDLAFDAGAAVDLATNTGKFRILGYLANKNYEKLKDYPNFKSSNSNFQLYFQWLGIMIPTDMHQEDRDVLTKELKNIVLQKSSKELALQNLSTITAVGQPEISAIAHRQRKLFKEYWK